MYVPSKRKIIFYIALTYVSQPYAEAMCMLTAVSYTPYATSPEEQTGGIITSAQFEEGGLLYETYDYSESGDKYDDNSIMSPLISKE